MSQSSLPNSAVEESSDSTYWYLLSEGKQIGPFFFSRLQQMARQGSLKLDDRVRRGANGDWVIAATLKDVLFVEVDANQSVIAPAVVKPVLTTEQPGFLTRIRHRVEGIVDGLYEEFTDRLSSFRVAFSWFGLIVVSISLLVLIARQIPFGGFFSDPIATYSSAWNELKIKRDLKAPAAEWDAYAESVRRQLKPIVERLERTASTDSPLDQQLLWAGRDYLPKMLVDARTAESDSEKKFALHLKQAKWLSEGKDLRGRRRGKPPQLLPLGTASDIATAVFGILFVAVDIWIVIWLMRKRKKPSA